MPKAWEETVPAVWWRWLRRCPAACVAPPAPAEKSWKQTRKRKNLCCCWLLHLLQVLPFLQHFVANTGVSVHTQKPNDFVNTGQYTLKQKTHDHKMVVLNQTTGLPVPISHDFVVYIKKIVILSSA